MTVDIRPFRPNWLEPDLDVYVRVEPMGRQHQQSGVVFCDVRPLAFVTKNKGGWIATLMDRPGDHIECPTLVDIMVLVDRLLEDRPSCSSQREPSMAIEKETSAPPPVRHVRLFSEALARANNITHDLENLDWIEASDEEFQDQLEDALGEAERVVACLRTLCGHNPKEREEDGTTTSGSEIGGSGRQGDDGAATEAD